MGVTPVSVVIVSRGRPQALRLCLTAVAQLDHPGFEVIVVKDATAGPGREAAYLNCGLIVNELVSDYSLVRDARSIDERLEAILQVVGQEFLCRFPDPINSDRQRTRTP